MHDPRWWFPILELSLPIKVGKMAELTSIVFEYIYIYIVSTYLGSSGCFAFSGRGKGSKEQQDFMISKSLML